MPDSDLMRCSSQIMSSSPPSGLVPREGLVTLAHVIYGLHAFSAITGLLSPAMIVTAFLTGWPSIIAVILNYLKRSEVRGDRKSVV